ncbi:probable indole-3-pyruvate monooxygenase YUCCA10 [Morus notabilis]|uniref:probable indole-3-pyruvate monooxygenase YUCCA10 n=1 Tax=Morus notabilis TaxID=981085 RepID=UPI000CED6AE0|nr:probable indole-3-pyruvate monooxygenase YUCCA10 [Morus notabilis]
MKGEEAQVIIAGAGTSGLATAACLTSLSIPYIILERDDCVASLWAKRGYDRLKLHLDKQICQLPNVPFPPSFPTYVPRELFLDYLNDYKTRFQIHPLYGRTVESAAYDAASEKWIVKARNNNSRDMVEESYSGRLLVVATGETAHPFVPANIHGLEGFGGEVLHSTEYKTGKEFEGKRVLVVGSGNSGMEIALDLADHGANTSIIVRSPVHLLTREIMSWCGYLLKYLPFKVVEYLAVMLSRLFLGDMTKYGIPRPQEGPFTMKQKYGKFPVIDVGTCKKIKKGEIQVLNAEIKSIRGNEALLNNGKSYHFDSIIFCTGFKRSTHLWLQDDSLLNDDGFADHWKGKNGLYSVGLSRRGFFGANRDAQNVANDIKSLL